MVFCSVCFGDPSSPMTQGYNYGVLVLLAITFIVLGSFGMLFLNIRRRTLKNQKFLH